MNTISGDVWRRIISQSGQVFRQVRGGEFSYVVCSDNVIRLDRTNQTLSRATFEKALARYPLSGPGAINDLRAPSYVYAILMDPRIGVHNN